MVQEFLGSEYWAICEFVFGVCLGIPRRRISYSPDIRIRIWHIRLYSDIRPIFGSEYRPNMAQEFLGSEYWAICEFVFGVSLTIQIYDYRKGISYAMRVVNDSLYRVATQRGFLSVGFDDSAVHFSLLSLCEIFFFSFFSPFLFFLSSICVRPMNSDAFAFSSSL